MKNLTFILFLCVLITSCVHQKTKEDTIFLEATEKEISPDALFSGINLIHLKEPDSIIIGRIDKIIKNESAYYLLDSRKSNGIFAYDDQGNYMAHYSAPGLGLRESTSIEDFDIDTLRNEIVLLCVPSKLIITDLQLSFIEEITLGSTVYYDRMVIIGENIYLFSYNKEIIAKYDRKGKLLEKTPIPNKLKKGNVFHPQPVFYKLPDKCLMQSPGDHIIYKEENGEWIKYLEIDYEKRISSIQLYTQKNEVDIDIKERLAHPLPYIYLFFTCKEKEYFVYSLLVFYINDGNNNFIYRLRGSSFNFQNDHLYAWEYLSNFNLEDPLFYTRLHNNEIKTLVTKQKDDLNDGILLIDYIIKK